MNYEKLARNRLTSYGKIKWLLNESIVFTCAHNDMQNPAKKYVMMTSDMETNAHHNFFADDLSVLIDKTYEYYLLKRMGKLDVKNYN